MLKFFKKKTQNLLSDKKFSEILSGSAWALSARVVGTLFGLAASVIIARVYGAELVGIVAVVNSFLMLATILTVLGTDVSILRLIPEHMVKYSPTSAFRVYHKAICLVIVTSIIFSTLFFFLSNQIASSVFRKPDWSLYIALASFFVLFSSLIQLNTQAVRGLKLIRIFALMQIFPQVFNLFFLILLSLLISTQNVPVYALLSSLVFTGVIGWIIMEYGFRARRQPSDNVHPLGIKKILSISIPMLMTSAMTFIIGQTGVLVTGMFRSEAEIGYYAIAVKLATLTTFILSAINSIAAPKFSELFHSGKTDELFYIAKKSAKLIFWTSSPILIGLIIFGKPVLSLAFGQDFKTAYPPLVLLVVGQFVNAISGSTGYFMNMTGNERIFKNIILTSAIINVLLSFILIPRMGIIGAAIAATISLVLWNAVTLIYIKTKFGNTTGYFPFSLK